MGLFTFTSVLVALVASTYAMGQGYELDQNKLDQRYDLIQSIVRAGVPGRGGYAGGSHKPTIGAAYKNPSIGYNRGAKAYASPQSYGGYNANNVYGAGRNNGGYGGYGNNRNYGNTGNYGYGSSYGNRGSYGNPVGYKLGGGVVHPIFNNDNLYKPVETVRNDYTDYNSNNPIYLGGNKDQGLYSQSGYPQKTTGYSQPQVNAYGSQPVNYNAKDTVGASYTGQKGNIYKNLPGYSNPYFKQY